MSTAKKRHSRRLDSAVVPPILAPTASAVTPDSATISPFIEPEQRHAMICEAAYYRSERRGFCPGRELDDWLTAEREIDQALTSGCVSPVDRGSFG